jgi:3-hydroxymyristoyl/3-hydroxydecanoyl-(acyl carrier protein) dehydratase
MSPHFAAYSFVDRIRDFVPAKHARGAFAVPPHLRDFSSCLVAEAVGQLAAWVSMAHIDFRGRPVAALATETRFHGDAMPGRTLELAVDIDDCDDDAVAYSGSASVDGKTIIELIHCLGPMLPVAEFDEPNALRERFALLRTTGASAHRFEGVTLPTVTTREHVPGQALKATLPVPLDAPFFGDHFPRRAVFPATLLLDTQIRLALDLAREALPQNEGETPRPIRVTNVKMRAFILPGQDVELTIDLAPAANGVAKASLGARIDERVVATARLEISATDIGVAGPPQGANCAPSGGSEAAKRRAWGSN